MQTVLTIAGSDSSGGAGIQADIKTMTAYGVYGMSVLTSVTAQNTCGVTEVQTLSGGMVSAQLQAVLADIKPDVIKIGMLGNGEVASAVADSLSSYPDIPIVIDPVILSTSGHALLDEHGQQTLLDILFPMATLITPNIPESEWISHEKITSASDMEHIAKNLYDRFGCAVLIKGGHLSETADDLLYDGKATWFSGTRIACENTHGTGCTLSSAIASALALEYSLPEAVSSAKEFVRGAMSTGLDLGQGNGPLNHCWNL
ncbi:MAG: bifunctional hydroxymethylpyrimidine kinase/phosphomethylpyrimidine kinase [Lachnospiraceae bacterium]|nr:bifunctional hydroxymethylpyrimidine kinase/phosphomethylpyrimidine kinase [Lachnospiraceae bacterium]